jgi:leader peptidase (prepilin peptidase)/N-methyltransferase
VNVAFAAVVFGPSLAIGSFLNVVAARLPLGRSVVSPRSACMHCGTEIRSRDNVPVISYLLLRGKCRDCGASIGWRYPAVELGTAVLVAASVLAFGLTLPRSSAQRSSRSAPRTSSAASCRTGSSCPRRSRCSPSS